MAMRITGEPEHLLDLRPDAPSGRAGFLLDYPATRCVGEATDGRLRAQVWRLGPFHSRWEYALVLACPGDADADAIVIQGSLKASTWSTDQALRALHTADVFFDYSGYNPAYAAAQTERAWQAAHGLYVAVRNPDAWWGEELQRPVPVMLAWASAGAQSWAEARSWLTALRRGTGAGWLRATVEWHAEAAETAQEWIGHGFAPEEVRLWADPTPDGRMTMSADEAAAWHDAGIPADRARFWMPYTAQQGILFERAGWTREIADYVTQVTRADRRDEGPRSWARSKVAMCRIPGYVGAGVSIREAKRQERGTPPSLANLATLAALRGHPIPAALLP